MAPDTRINLYRVLYEMPHVDFSGQLGNQGMRLVDFRIERHPALTAHKKREYLRAFSSTGVLGRHPNGTWLHMTDSKVSPATTAHMVNPEIPILPSDWHHYAVFSDD